MTNLKEEQIQKLIDFNNKINTGHGYNYVIVTRSKNNCIYFHERQQEPCYGGLRKYKATHGDEATQPEHKPGDLHHKFPTGEPIVLSFPFPEMREDKFDEMWNFLWGPESPWIKGFESPEKLITTYYDKGAHKGKRSGVILTSTDIDPTVLVNLCKFCHAYAQWSITKFTALMDEGLSPFEAITAICFDNQNTYSPKFNNGYMFCFKPNLKNFKEGKPNDFTGGTLRNRFDYSRKNIQDLFKDDQNGIIFSEALKAAGANKLSDVKAYAKAVKEVVAKYV
jgi:hypothetical protein